MKTQAMQMNKGIVVLLINKIYESALPISIRTGKTVCIDQSIAGFENKQYLQDVTFYYEEKDEEIFNTVLNQAVCQYSQS